MLHKKLYILLFVVLSVFTHANAANTYDKLIVEFGNEKDTCIIINEKLIVEFGADVVYIRATDDSFYTEFDYKNIQRIYFGDNSKPSETLGPVDDITNKLKPSRFTFEYVDGQTIRMTGVDETTKVALYSIDGKRMPMDAERNDDEVTIHLDGFQRGFYIIKTNNQSFKIYKK